MTAMLTSHDLAARTDLAVAAAVDAGRGLGLVVTDPRVLYDLFSVVVHLWPAPVVVRVPTVVPRTVVADPDTQVAQQRRSWPWRAGSPTAATRSWRRVRLWRGNPFVGMGSR